MSTLAILDRLLTKAMFALARRHIHPLGDPCDKLSDEDANGDVPALPRGFVGERISHSPENDRG